MGMNSWFDKGSRCGRMQDMQRGLLSMLILLGILILSGCGQPSDRPYRIGFISTLSGRDSRFGINHRQGAQMMVELLNKEGGIHNRRLELLIKDDKGTEEGALIAWEALLAEDADLIIGLQTSGLTRPVFDQANLVKRILIGNSATSSEFSGKDDYFFRVVADTESEAQSLSTYVETLWGGEIQAGDKVVFLADLGNETYSRVWARTMIDHLEDLQGLSFELVEFQGNESLNHAQLVRGVLNPAHPGLVVLIGGAVDTAFFAQRFREQGYTGKILSSRWGKTEDMLAFGGRAVEGIVFSEMFKPGGQASAAYEGYFQNFLQRFGKEADFSAVHSSEAILLIAQALRSIPPPQGRAALDQTSLRMALRDIDGFQGIVDWIDLKAHGDAQRPQHLITIENGAYVELQ